MRGTFMYDCHSSTTEEDSTRWRCDSEGCQDQKELGILRIPMSSFRSRNWRLRCCTTIDTVVMTSGFANGTSTPKQNWHRQIMKKKLFATPTILSKSEIFHENRDFHRNSRFSSKFEIFVKNRIFHKNSRFSTKSKILTEIRDFR